MHSAVATDVKQMIYRFNDDGTIGKFDEIVAFKGTLCERARGISTENCLQVTSHTMSWMPPTDLNHKGKVTYGIKLSYFIRLLASNVC